jgi:hypothetical protein
MRVLTLLLLLALAGCGSLSQDPLGVGRGTDALKESPCVCAAPFYQHGKLVS